MTYAVTAVLVLVETFVFTLAFVLFARRSKSSEKRRDGSSLLGLLLQLGGVFVGLLLMRPPATPLLQPSAGYPAFVDLALSALAVLLGLLAIAFTVTALKALGRNWAYSARILADHKLVRSGPYAVVRHPIYTAMISMNIAAVLAFSRWEGVLVCIVMSFAGTWMRVRREERLLSQTFGHDFADYAASVPAIVPGLRLRGRALSAP